VASRVDASQSVALGGRWAEQGPLSIRYERDPEELWVIELYGELDMAGEEVAALEIQRAEASDAQQIIVDLSGLDFIDSSGLAVLLAAQMRSRQSGDRLVFLRATGQVESTLAMTQLDSWLDFAD
jgi:anti-sigma B factor antagonist